MSTAEQKSSTDLNIAGKLAKIFIHSKITMMIMIAVTLAGVLAYLVTPREYNPQIVVRAISLFRKAGQRPAKCKTWWSNRWKPLWGPYRA